MFFYFIKLLDENQKLRSNLINILEKKEYMTLDEYELYLSLQPIRKINIKQNTKKYPPLPLSDDED
jgi:hypothetical protein